MAEVARSRIGVATYVAPPGPLADGKAVAELGDKLQECLAAREIHLIVDFINVTLINSAALGLLLDVRDEVVRIGGELEIAHAGTVVCGVLALTEIADRIPLVDAPAAGSVVTRIEPAGPVRLGRRLVERGVTTEAAIAEAVKLQADTGRRLGHILVELGHVTERDLLGILSEQLSLPLVHLRTGLYDPEIARLLPAAIAQRLSVVPLFGVRGTLFLATADPQAIPSLDTVEELTGMRVRPVLATREEITAAITEAHGEDHDLSEYIGELDSESEFELIAQAVSTDFVAIDEIATGSPVINLINGLIQRAVRDGVSDVHIEPMRNRCQIRFRIDGVLYPAMSPPKEIHPALVSRLKVMANLDIAERRLPQDGRIQVYTHGRTVDLRFSSLPGIFGEKVVLRVLDKSTHATDINTLGMSDETLGSLKRLLCRSHGLILVTGPTGSGKTTTLYAALSHLNTTEKSIVTIEDPVEYQIDIINQNQIKESVDLTFAKMLKHILRQDPDIIMVGEIRELETAEIAVQAALTGHLVLSTLHTNDSAGAITRLLDMGIEPFLLSSALVGVMAQRLVRVVCEECRTSYVAPAGSLARFDVPEDETFCLVRGRGCTTCYDSGYRGRMAIHELLEPDAVTQRLMLSSPSRDDLTRHFADRGLTTLLGDGIRRALEGRTTIEEVTRVVNL